MYFSPPEISLVGKAFRYAGEMAEDYFRLGRSGLKAHRYEVKTLAHLSDHEVSDTAFAHLCRYMYQKEGKADHPDNFYFFTICLQDDRILDAVKRSEPFVRLEPLMLYIAAHELVHVVRFGSREIDFDAPLEEKIAEEEKVHSITRSMLRPVAGADINLVLDCFSNRYRIGDICDDRPAGADTRGGH
ncbi:MAG: hypothetical protein JXI32_02625 [Deltaproteobacteria bacterium]|nr:hypothetical protein [Deltaproteobacteria bacterium]